MPQSARKSLTRPREKYSRVICLGCRDRRIRCEGLEDVDVPESGELRTARTPCYRCRRLGAVCVIRQTILGRPAGHGNEQAAVTASHPTEVGDTVRHAGAETHLPMRSTQPPVPRRTTPRHFHEMSLSDRDHQDLSCSTVMWYTPMSFDAVVRVRAVETLTMEGVQEEWFRHLPSHVGHTAALDLSIKALVAACAFSRGVPGLTTLDCYKVVAVALSAVRNTIKNPESEPSDDLVASIALLAPFEGVVHRNGIPTRFHVEGLAALLAARTQSHPVSSLVREIIDFHACEVGVMSCLQGTLSPFEKVNRVYYAVDAPVSVRDDRVRMKSLANEMFVHIPRLVILVRSIRCCLSSRDRNVRDAVRLLEALLDLQDCAVEQRMSCRISHFHAPSVETVATLRHNLQFTTIKDFEALTCYWQGRLWLLRLEQKLHGLRGLSGGGDDSAGASKPIVHSTSCAHAAEMLRLTENLLRSTEYLGTLVLFRMIRVFAQALVIVWGTLIDSPMVLNLSGEICQRSSLLDLALRKVSLALETAAIRPDDMDVAADAFLGAHSSGRFAALFGHSK